MKHMLIIDDEPGTRESLKAIFAGTYKVSAAAGADQAMALLSVQKVDVILLDVIMPQKDGIMFLREAQHLYPDLPIIMVSASTSVRPVVEAIRIGAFDYVTKPFEVSEIRRMVERALESTSLQRRIRVLERDLSREFPVGAIVGESPSFLRAMEDARKAAETDSTVLVTGESGTGKELLARLVHDLSSRKDEPFVAVHCGGLPETLMESELFGHEKGAFTSADKRKLGRFDLAASGSLFFDEVSEMPASTQVKLLRVLEQREFMRVGGTQIIKTDARIIAATNKDLQDLVADGKFRQDLYYRLGVVPVQLPPLRERPEDIPLLAKYFLNHFKQSIDAAINDLDEHTMQLFCSYAWPGNVRELRNIIERMLVLHRDSVHIQPEFLPREFHNHSFSPPPAANGKQTLEQAVNEYERHMVERALRESGGIQTKAAEILGTTRRILKYRMEKLDIAPLPN